MPELQWGSFLSSKDLPLTSQVWPRWWLTGYWETLQHKLSGEGHEATKWQSPQDPKESQWSQKPSTGPWPKTKATFCCCWRGYMSLPIMLDSLSEQESVSGRKTLGRPHLSYPRWWAHSATHSLKWLIMARCVFSTWTSRNISCMDRDISFEAVISKAATSVTFVLVAILWHTIPLTWGCGVRGDEEEGGNIH